MVSGRQRLAGAERAESTSPLLRGFSSQWGRGGCLPQPESPGNPAAQGLLAFSPAEQGRLAGIDSVRGTKTGRSGVRGVGCWGRRQWRRRLCVPASVRGKIGKAAAFEASSAANHNGEAVAQFCRACAQQRSETRWSSQGIAASHDPNCQILPTPGSSITPLKTNLPSGWLTGGDLAGAGDQPVSGCSWGEPFSFQG